MRDLIKLQMQGYESELFINYNRVFGIINSENVE
jgi:hypothetical protein